jgi:hypothetical protein
MTSDKRNSGTDRSLGQDLEAIRAAWQVLPQDEPPDLLDQSVRNAAHRALPLDKRRRSVRWLGSLATAAVVVLAVAIVIRQDPEGPVPPLPKSDGFRLDPAVTTERRASDAKALDREPGHAEITLQRASRAAVSESPPPTAEKAPAAAPLDAMEEDAASPAPADWLERMLQLQQAGRLEELQAELEAFRKTYPGYPLPPELRE